MMQVRVDRKMNRVKYGTILEKDLLEVVRVGWRFTMRGCDYINMTSGPQ